MVHMISYFLRGLTNLRENELAGLFQGDLAQVNELVKVGFDTPPLFELIIWILRGASSEEKVGQVFTGLSNKWG